MDADLPSNSSTNFTRFFPGLGQLRNYRREWLAGDLLAGVSVCIVMVPSVIAYAGLMGLPPQYGLYAALVSLILYPLFGSSRHLIAGPDIAVSLLIAGAVIPLAGGDPIRTIALTGMITLLSGVMLILAAQLKIGSVADFFAKPVLVGYMTGAALILMGSQLNKIFGVTLTRNDFFPRLAELFGKLNEIQPVTLIFGLSLLALIILLRRILPKFPPALIVCVVAVLVSAAFDLEKRGVAVVGQFPGGLPTFVMPYADWKDVHALLPAVIGIALLTYTQGILLARAFAQKHGYEVNPNQELVALGITDLGAAFFQGFAGTGAQSRTAVNDAAGAKTQLSSLIAAVTLALFLLLLTPVIARLPVVALAAILVYSGSTLVEFDVMKRIYRYYPRSAGVAAVTTLGVLAAGVVPGILLGVVLSLLGLINRISNPPDAVLREVPGHGFHDFGATPTGQLVPGLLMYRFYAPLLFSNIGHFVDRVRKLIAANPTPVTWFLLDAQAITDIDVTAAEALRALQGELQARGIAFKIAHANRPLRDILGRTDLASVLEQGSFFDSVHECVDAFRA